MFRTKLLVALIIATIASTAPMAQDQKEHVNREVYWKIRAEAAERSQILNSLHVADRVPQPQGRQ